MNFKVRGSKVSFSKLTGGPDWTAGLMFDILAVKCLTVPQQPLQK